MWEGGGFGGGTNAEFTSGVGSTSIAVDFQWIPHSSKAHFLHSVGVAAECTGPPTFVKEVSHPFRRFIIGVGHE